jgi:RND family efflux transporter MFP subunit
MKYATTLVLFALTAALTACGSDHAADVGGETAPVPDGSPLAIVVAARPAYQPVSGVAQPVREATLGTRLMGAVVDVMAREGDEVRAGAPLVRVDSRDLSARASQVDASLVGAEAAFRQADQHAARMRALYAEEAAPRAQLDAAEADLERARAGVSAVRASAAEIVAMRAYAVISAPFNGTVTARMIDPGSFAAPGTPLLVVQDLSALRISVTAAPAAARGVQRGDMLSGFIDGMPVEARVEGVVPARSGSLFTINAIVDNAARTLLPGSATLSLPVGLRDQILVPQQAVVRRSDLSGVYLKRQGGAVLRWIRLGAVHADSVEVLSGLAAGDTIIVPVAPVR